MNEPELSRSLKRSVFNTTTPDPRKLYYWQTASKFLSAIMRCCIYTHFRYNIVNYLMKHLLFAEELQNLTNARLSSVPDDNFGLRLSTVWLPASTTDRSTSPLPHLHLLVLLLLLGGRRLVDDLRAIVPCLQMALQIPAPGQLLPAQAALIQRPIVLPVQPDVFVQIARIAERAQTVLALERLKPGVRADVYL